MNDTRRPHWDRFGWARTALLAIVLTAGAMATAHAQEIGFIERFALAEDRAEVLKELIPGTEDYYFFHGLHYQNTGDEAKFEATMTQWEKRVERSSQRDLLRNRQALINFDRDPRKSVEYLTKALGVTFNHQRERRQTDPDLATQLDPELIQLKAIVERSLRDERNLGEVSVAGIDYLMRHWRETKLSVSQKRELLGKLRRPDYPALVSALAEDLGRRESKGFGEFPVHRLLLRPQLEELAGLYPKLLGDESFVLTTLGKLRPGADVDLERDLVAKTQYLDRAWEFVAPLGSAFHSLKANLLHARLKHDLKSGEYDRERFLTYLKLPRPVHHVNPRYRERLTLWRYPVDFNFDCSAVTGLSPIRNDEDLVRAYLLHFLTGASDYNDFAPFLTEAYLRGLHAEANIVAGLGDVEKWSSQLAPSVYQALKDRVDLEFDPACKERFGPNETAQLDLHIKNVENLMVKIYEINTPNYYRNTGRQLNTDLNLDGLVANEELSFDYDEGPFKRVKRQFTFPQLDGARGAWVLEFIGNGKSSRAVILRGGLQYLMRPSSAGHALRILDEGREPVPGGFVWMQGKRYDANENGEIVIPFSNRPGSKQILLQDGQGFASLENLNLLSERYQLSAGFYVDREQLLAGKEASLAVRPQFTLNGAPADVSLLEDVVLTLTSTDLDGVSATATVPDFKLYAHKESIHRLQVPDRLSRLAFQLTAKVKNLSQGKDENLAASGGLKINNLTKTEAVSDLFLSKVQSGFRVQLLGRTGEAISNTAINFNLRRDDFRTDVRTTLRTDETGTVHLGELEGIYRVTVQAPNGRKYRWVLPQDRRLYPSTIHARVGEAIAIPVLKTNESEGAFALLERSHGSYVEDRSDAISLQTGSVELRGLPPGDFALFLSEAERPVTIRVTAGEESNGFLLGEARNLEKRNMKSLHLAPLRVEGEELVVQLEHANAYTRVHLLGTRHVPPFEALDALGNGTNLEPLVGWPARVKNLYVSGRAIGDEYRYIIERRYAEKYPGNMLERPGVLLNPWELRDTSTDLALVQAGQSWGAAARAPEASAAARESARLRADGGGEPNDPHFVDFLAASGISVFNVAPGDDGVLRVKLTDLGDCSHVRVVAVDPMTAVERHLALPAKKPASLDLRLAEGLNPKRHFTQRDEVTVLLPDKEFVIDDVAAADFEAYETIGDVFQLFRTLSEGKAGHLEEFAFLLDWPEKELAEKRKLYSKYASHELNFFLQRKDAEFFESVVRPYLANKRDATFMDLYLLGEDLSHFLNPWRFAQLNVVERILLAERLPDERESIVRDVRDWLALLPPEQRLDLLNFDQALGSTALYDSKANFGINEMKKAVRRAARPAPRGAEALDALEDNVAFDREVEEDGVELRSKARSLGLQQLGEKAESLERLQELGDLAANLSAVKGFAADKQARGRVRQLYRKLESTKELAENNYYQLPIDRQNGELVSVNKFWNDFAAHDGETPFVSKHIAEASGNFTEMILALAVLDLPFEAPGGEEKAKLEERSLTLKPSAPVILFHKELREAAALGQGTQLLVSQHFFREGDRFSEENGEKVDKFVEEEFLTGVVYGCKVVVTNPTSSNQRLHLLQQIPVGAIPVKGSKATQNSFLRLNAYQTHTQECFFYFPQAGQFQHFPVHVSQGEQVAAFAQPFSFQVVDELSETDTSSWDYVSQWGSEADVLAYLKQHNLRETDLRKIAWRCRESDGFFKEVIEILDNRYHYDPVLYSYALYHQEREPLREYLMHADGFLGRAGDYLASELITIDPVERRNYQHLEYSPLVNARSYELGGKRTILNDRFRAQYGQLMRIFSQRPSLDDADRMTLTVYLLLQDRIGEALDVYERIDAEALPTRLQYDYLQAYLAFYREDPSTARAVATRYAEYPVDRWRKRFREITAQLDEIEGRTPREIGEDDERRQHEQQENLAANDPSLTFKVEDQRIDLLYANLSSVRVNYYRMDLEFLFSTNPFMASDGARFSMIKPNRSDRHELDADGRSLKIPLPAEFDGENVLVEVIGGGLRRTSAYYSNRLDVQLAANYGHLQVLATGEQPRPLPKTYVKVYAEIDGKPQFYKDGYTDLRGKFDYASLSTGEIDRTSRFSILVMSEGHGALVQETNPPQR